MPVRLYGNYLVDHALVFLSLSNRVMLYSKWLTLFICVVGYFSLCFILLEVAIFFEVKEKSHYLSSGFDALMASTNICIKKCCCY
jgi:hypothetical protein